MKLSRQHFIKLSLMILSSLALSACMTSPHNVQFEQPNTNFNQVAQSPDSFVGNQVRWGGIVARVENLEQDTLVEIVNLPLDRQARPVASQQTGGRFIARIQGFVDPIIYQQGKEITVVGVLGEPMPGMIGKHKVNFPVVDTQGHELWQQRQSYNHTVIYSSWDPLWFYSRPYRWHYPYFHSYNHYRYPYHRRTIRSGTSHIPSNQGGHIRSTPTPAVRQVEQPRPVPAASSSRNRSSQRSVVRENRTRER